MYLCWRDSGIFDPCLSCLLPSFWLCIFTTALSFLPLHRHSCHPKKNGHTRYTTPDPAHKYRSIEVAQTTGLPNKTRTTSLCHPPPSQLCSATRRRATKNPASADGSAQRSHERDRTGQADMNKGRARVRMMMTTGWGDWASGLGSIGSRWGELGRGREVAWAGPVNTCRRSDVEAGMESRGGVEIPSVSARQVPCMG